MAKLKKTRFKELRVEKEAVAKLFQSRCYVCRRKYGKKFTFHHKTYTDGEKHYADFNGNQREYLEYILPIIRKKPKQYALLCGRHHIAVEIGKRYNADTFERLIRLVKQSR